MKKLVSRFMAVLMAMTMILSMSMTAFAADAPKGTLTVNNTVAGKTLDLYQIFTATKSGENVAYTLNSAYEGFFKNNTRIPGSEDLTGEALSDAAYNYVKTQVGPDGSNGAEFAKAILGWILENNTTVAATHTNATTTADATVINNLDYGYYVVYPLGATDTSTAPGNEKVKSVASLVSVTGIDATVNMKSNYPTVDKKIIPAQSGSGITIGAIVNGNWEGNHQMELDDENESEDTIAPHGATDEKKVGDFGIGDTVTYQLTSKVPDMTGYNSYTFKFSDTLSKGLDLKEVLSVKVGNTTVTAKSTGANTYALAYDKSNRKVLHHTFAYQVDQILTVLPSDTDALQIEKGKDYVTLVTCTPYAVNTHRLLVRGTRIPYEEAQKIDEEVGLQCTIPFNLILLIAGIVAFIIIWVSIKLHKRRKEKKHEQNHET